MEIKLTAPFAANGGADEFDVRQMKKALNRLGYYQSYEKIGITAIADAAVFDALKRFQTDHGLYATGTAKPDDDTIQTLNREIAKTPDGYYIWRTAEDDKVRSNHAGFNRTIRSWDDTPDPGEEFNCRCWAEKIAVPKDLEPSLLVVLRRLTDFKNDGYQLSTRLLEHYLGKTGETITLKSSQFDNSTVVQSAIEDNHKRFEDDFLGKIKMGQANSFYNIILQLTNNASIHLSDYWDVNRQKTDFDVLRDADFARAIGSGKIRSSGNFQISKKGNQITITGHVVHSINDRYDFDRYDFNDDTWFDFGLLVHERELAKRGYAKPFDVYWQKKEIFEGSMAVHESKLEKPIFTWRDDSVAGD